MDNSLNKSFDAKKQNRLAKNFKALHHGEQPLVLVNAWDALSAKIIENGGIPAIATTSSGISWSLGYKDGEHTPPQLMVDAIHRIARVVDLPVSADIEGGYFRTDLDKFSWFIGEIIEAGAVGINLEDGYQGQKKLNSVEYQVKEIEAARKVAQQKGVELFINARTDAIEKAPGNLEARIQACIERAHAFEKAGADGIFIPFIQKMETIKLFKDKIEAPLNVLMSPSLQVEKLFESGVNRISVGGKPKLVAMHHLMQITKELKERKQWDSLFVSEPNHPQANSWFS